MKQREFWIPEDVLNPYYAGPGGVEPPLIHVRPVSPELDLAISGLVEAFKKYASHKYDCKHLGPGHECSCGFNEALASYKAAVEAKGQG